MAPDPNTNLDAAAILHRLTSLDPARAAPEVQLIDMAAALVGQDLTYAQWWLPWARYAYHAVQQLDQPDPGRLVRATRSYAETLRFEGHHEQAIPVWRELLDLRGRQPADTGDVDARIALAADLHAVGRCGQAIREIDDALNDARVYQLEHPELAIVCTVAYTAMLNACRRVVEATVVRSELPTLYQPGGPLFRLLAGTYVLEPEPDEHHEVCAARLDALLDGATAVTSGQQRSLLARRAAAMNPGPRTDGREGKPS
ncbi:hypothetical protein Ato02nite_097480 [Paractinoplanes toevensis]|uniref:Tetratricopeptide repeat protein n=2 Tax=Paractinoplanes toevensis TaxID=571911 RepID=A0A919WCZ4_9ACTN|nr:hypothetical protein Ato02nite_097480 [Actinoplanes toevensis]